VSQRGRRPGRTGPAVSLARRHLGVEEGRIWRWRQTDPQSHNGGGRFGGGGRYGHGWNESRGACRRKFIREEATREEKGRHTVARSSEATMRVASSSSGIFAGGKSHTHSGTSRGEPPPARSLTSDVVPQIFCCGANPNIGRIF
jgi:hypothetical protein